MSFRLEYDQNGQHQEYPFDGASVSVGREQSADFVLDHPTVSRQHAVIVQDSQGFKLVVLSKSGLTAIDGTQVHGEVDLYDGSVIHFGQLSFTFRSPEAHRKPSSGPSAQYGLGGSSPSNPGFGSGSSNPGLGTGASSQGFGSGPINSGVGSESSNQGAGNGQGQSGFGQTPGASGAGQGPGGGGQFGGGQFGGGQFGGGQFGGGQFGGGVGQQQGGLGEGSGAQSESAPAKPASDDGIMSWDAIAATAKDDDDAGGSQTNFERIQAAAKKADKQSSSNPVVLIGGGILIVGMLIFILMPDGPVRQSADPSKNPEEIPYITWEPGVLDCVGEAECMAKARQNYNVGTETLDKVEVDIRNRYEGYRRLRMAEEFAKRAGYETLPAEFADLEQRRDQARDELDTIFQRHRVNYIDWSKRKMYTEMVDVLSEVMAVFPYKSAREHQWALGKERQLKEQGNYPQTFR